MRFLWLAAFACGASAETGADFFEKQIRPVLVEKCYSCHSAKLKEPMGGLRLDVKVADERVKRRIIQGVGYESPEFRMPPTGKLPAEVIADFRRWIEMGAPDPRADAEVMKRIEGRDYWAFRPLGKAEVKLKPAVQGPADKRTWLRRVTLDLTGLPPTGSEVDAFLADGSTEKVVERLLASPHYGERWARHWLDLVRFAETNGHEFDNEKLDAWQYRDYVIRAFNADVPYDQFVREHLAGDLLPYKRMSADGAFLESPLATGFFWFGEVLNSATDSVKSRADTVDNQIDVIGKTFLGLTLACARCHDHKFDPISTKDYYALAGVMHSTAVSEAVVDSPERTAEIRAKVSGRGPAPPSGFQWTSTGQAFEGPVVKSLVGSLTSNKFTMPKLWVHVRMAGSAAESKLGDRAKLRVTVVADDHKSAHLYLTGKPGFYWKSARMTKEIGRSCYFEIVDRDPEGWIVVDRIVISDDPKPPVEEGGVAEATDSAVPASVWGMIAKDENPGNARVHVRGSHKDLGEEVPRRFLELFDAKPFSRGSGRLELAEAIATNPLTARVMVNRIWLHHFGQALVKTSDNFGRNGDRPSDPELLESLAAKFVESGWRVKEMDRMMVLSEPYMRQGGVRRLEAEAIRDSILAVSGSLDRTVYGESVMPHISKYQDGRGKPVSGPLDGNGRRSIYIQVRRNFITPMFLAFDYPLPVSTMGSRGASTVPSQALMMLNNEFVAGEAKKWAERVCTAEADSSKRVEKMYVAAFARPPAEWELRETLAFAEKNGWADLAHVLFNSAEFIYVH